VWGRKVGKEGVTVVGISASKGDDMRQWKEAWTKRPLFSVYHSLTVLPISDKAPPSMAQVFNVASQFNGDLSSWDVSRLTEIPSSKILGVFLVCWLKETANIAGGGGGGGVWGWATN
jgi:hypothetical protein